MPEMPDTPQKIICIDYETTGLPFDKQKKRIVEKQLILEVAAVAVSLPDFEIVDEFSTVIRWPIHQVREHCDRFVLDMHTKNALLAEIEIDGQSMLNVESGGLPILSQAEDALCAFYDMHIGGQCPLMGANPDFDREFMRAHMPMLEGRFHYRNFDTNSLYQLAKWLFGFDGKLSQEHRALADCRTAVAGVHRFFELVGGGFSGRIEELESELAALSPKATDWLRRAE